MTILTTYKSNNTKFYDTHSRLFDSYKKEFCLLLLATGITIFGENTLCR
jgi:hypothetical protein